MFFCVQRYIVAPPPLAEAAAVVASVPDFFRAPYGQALFPFPMLAFLQASSYNFTEGKRLWECMRYGWVSRSRTFDSWFYVRGNERRFTDSSMLPCLLYHTRVRIICQNRLVDIIQIIRQNSFRSLASKGFPDGCSTGGCVFMRVCPLSLRSFRTYEMVFANDA